MTVCTRCHRPLKRPTETGLGPVCAKTMEAVPVGAYERDLFGYDLERAELAARYQLQVLIESMAAEARMAIHHGFNDARRALGVWQ